MSEPLRILGIAGSLRRASINQGLIRAAQDLAPEGIAVSIADIASLPVYDADLDQEGGPASVRAFKEQIQRSDALLMATPEYCGSFSGVLKNAIDWASRPAASSVLRGKPIAIMGAAGGGTGTMKAQLHLRQVLHNVRTIAMLEPELAVVGAAEKFDQDGNLQDPSTRASVRAVVEALAAWTRRLG